MCATQPGRPRRCQRPRCSAFQSGFSGTWRISADRGPTDGYMNTTVIVNVSAEGQRPDLETELASATQPECKRFRQRTAVTKLAMKLCCTCGDLCPPGRQRALDAKDLHCRTKEICKVSVFKMKGMMWSSYVTWKVSPSVNELHHEATWSSIASKGKTDDTKVGSYLSKTASSEGCSLVETRGKNQFQGRCPPEKPGAAQDKEHSESPERRRGTSHEHRPGPRPRRAREPATQGNSQAVSHFTCSRPVLGSVPFLLIARFWGRRPL